MNERYECGCPRAEGETGYTSVHRAVEGVPPRTFDEYCNRWCCKLKLKRCRVKL